MKKIILIFTVFTFFTINTFAQSELTATFKGINDDGLIEFRDSKNKVILFDEIGEDVEIDLYDEESIDKKFKISWIEKEEEIYNDEDIAELVKIKIITKLVEL